jgi:hypothetical protein
MKLEMSTRNILTDAQTAIVNEGFAKIYNEDDDLLVSIPLKAQAFDPSNQGIAHLNVSGGLSGQPVLSGTASYFTMCDTDELPQWSDLCGTDDDGKTLQLTSLDIFIGVPVAIQSGTLTTPEGERI